MEKPPENRDYVWPGESMAPALPSTSTATWGASCMPLPPGFLVRTQKQEESLASGIGARIKCTQTPMGGSWWKDISNTEAASSGRNGQGAGSRGKGGEERQVKELPPSIWLSDCEPTGDCGRRRGKQVSLPLLLFCGGGGQE